MWKQDTLCHQSAAFTAACGGGDAHPANSQGGGFWLPSTSPLQEAELRRREVAASAAAAGAHAGEMRWVPAVTTSSSSLSCSGNSSDYSAAAAAAAVHRLTWQPRRSASPPWHCRPLAAARAVMLVDVSAPGWPCLYATEQWCRATGGDQRQRVSDCSQRLHALETSSCCLAHVARRRAGIFGLLAGTALAAPALDCVSPALPTLITPTHPPTHSCPRHHRACLPGGRRVEAISL